MSHCAKSNDNTDKACKTNKDDLTKSATVNKCF